MKVLVVSLNNAVGKSAIALELAKYLKAECITNAAPISRTGECVQLEAGETDVPQKHLRRKKVVFDFNLYSQDSDSRLEVIAQGCDVIVVPTLTDPQCLYLTVDTIKLFEVLKKPMMIVVNNFENWSQFETASKYFRENLDEPKIAYIKKTTLFDRVFHQGRHWLEK